MNFNRFRGKNRKLKNPFGLLLQKHSTTVAVVLKTTKDERIEVENQSHPETTKSCSTRQLRARRQADLPSSALMGVLGGVDVGFEPFSSSHSTCSGSERKSTNSIKIETLIKHFLL